MIKIYRLFFGLTILLCCSVFKFYAQLNYDWVKSFDDKGNVTIKKIITDNDGNLIIGGEFDYANFIMSSNDSIINQGMTDVFILKTNTSGNIIWKTSLGGNQNEYISDMIMVGDNIYITGSFSSNSIQMRNKTITSNWPFTVYIMKLDKDGDYMWSNQSTNGHYCYTYDIFKDIHSNLYIVGKFNGQITFGSFDLQMNSPTENSFVCKYSGNDVLQWADLFVLDSTNYNNIYVDNDENIYLTGSILKKIQVTPESYRHKNYFHVTKFNNERKKIWSFIDTSAQNGMYITKLDDNILALSETKPYYEISLCNTYYRTNNTADFFLLDKVGNEIKHKKYTGIIIEDISIDNDNHIYATGSLFADELMLGNDHLQRETDSSGECNEYPDVLVAKFDNSLNPVWAKSHPGEIDDQGTSIVRNKNSYIYIGGIYESSSLHFGDHTIYNSNPLQIFGHVSGTYYDRRINSFIMKSSDGPVSVPDIPGNTFTVYPLPVHDKLYIELADDNHEENDLRIYNQSGQLVLHHTFIGNKKTIDLNHISKGCYIIHITKNNKTYKGKLIK